MDGAARTVARCPAPAVQHTAPSRTGHQRPQQQGAQQSRSQLACEKRSRTREAPTPTNISTNSEALRAMKVTPASPATALHTQKAAAAAQVSSGGGGGSDALYSRLWTWQQHAAHQHSSTAYRHPPHPTLPTPSTAPGQQRLAGAGGPAEQDAAGDAGPRRAEALGLGEEVNNLLQLHLQTDRQTSRQEKPTGTDSQRS